LVADFSGLPVDFFGAHRLIEVNATIRLQNAALFCLSALGLPQASADLQEKGIGSGNKELVAACMVCQ